MTQQDKRINRLKSQPADYSWRELVSVLASLGFAEKKDKKGGSHRIFEHPIAGNLHLPKPHPGPIVKRYVIREVIQKLQRSGLL